MEFLPTAIGTQKAQKLINREIKTRLAEKAGGDFLFNYLNNQPFPHYSYLFAFSSKLNPDDNVSSKIFEQVKSQLLCIEDGRPIITRELTTIVDEVMLPFIINSMHNVVKNKVKIECINEFEFHLEKKEVNAALDAISTLYPLLWNELYSLVDRIVLFKGDGIVGASSMKAFGSIYIRISTDLSKENMSAKYYYLEHIVHEEAHTFLNSVFLFDEIISKNGATLYSSPLRPDKRPLRSVLHATFVLGRLIYVFKMLSVPFCEERFKYFLSGFDKGMETLENHSQFTPFGSEFIQKMISFRESI